MGSLNCFCQANNNYSENKNQVMFITDTNESSFDENKVIFYSPNIGKQCLEQVKSGFKNILKVNEAKFISEKTFQEILEKTNPELENIKFPKEIEEKMEKDIFITAPVRFKSGDIYKGSWNTSGQRDGFGLNISQNGIIYKGFWTNDKIDKYGLILFNDKSFYLGEIKQGKFEGNGEMNIMDKYKYSGNFNNDMPNGKGCIEDYQKGWKYKGDIVAGKKEGSGTLEFVDRTIYEGGFKNDLYDGNGILKFKNGNIYKGGFKEGKINGIGKYIWANGEIYEGEYKNFMKCGYGKYFWNDKKYYEGNWLNNQKHGKGSLHYNNKEIQGVFRFGKIIKESGNQ